MLDGIDLRRPTLESLRRNVTLVQQQTLMFHGTVQDNIAYGAATGRDTVIGQHGHGLSGGQRQRIAIAGARAADAPVLAPDEPTTSLDAASVDRLLSPLRRLATGRTTILITHDARLCATADRALALTDGRIEVDRGGP